MKRNYNDPIYKDWRKKIYNRDNFTCQWPGCNSKKKLNAHHIYRWADFPGLRYHIHNGITLCKIHHDMIKNNEDNYRYFFSKLVSNKKNIS
jgi:predicted restriction endonuclease